MFYVILLGVPLLNLLWWWWADGRLRTLPSERRWRGLLAAFMLMQLSIYAWSIATRVFEVPVRTPLVPLAAAYIWHLVVLPITMAVLGLTGIGRLLGRLARWAGDRLRRAGAPKEMPAVPHAPGHPADVPNADALRLSRRQFLAAAAVAAPPLLVGGGVARALPRLDDFRIRRLDVPLAGLPRELDGLTIAHVTDVHVGRYTNGKLLRRIADRTNDLRADLICLTGDLIDHDLVDLPAALDMVRRFDPRHGLFMCEGNHDLFESRETFESTVQAAGVPLLLNEASAVEVRGRTVQLFGIRWGRAGGKRRDPAIEAHLTEALAHRRPEAFPILLAHHPHAFDAAGTAGIPLTLAGHTHGGQLMLSDQFGLAPLAFKYWSGLYRQADSALVVSNGVGNWFPLRVNAPAEVVHLTLRAV